MFLYPFFLAVLVSNSSVKNSACTLLTCTTKLFHITHISVTSSIHFLCFLDRPPISGILPVYFFILPRYTDNAAASPLSGDFNPRFFISSLPSISIFPFEAILYFRVESCATVSASSSEFDFFMF